MERNEIFDAGVAGGSSTAGGRLGRALSRIAATERAFGDPWSTENPVGLAAVLAADESAQLLAVGVRRYLRLRMPEELVPVDLGGRMEGLDLLGPLMRPLFRRDPALAFGYGFTPFMGAMMVWLNGNDAQKLRVTDAVLGGGTVGVACQRFEHESEFHRQEYRASEAEAGFRLHGTKTAINNAHTADLIVGFVSSGDGQTDYSILMFDPAAVPPESVRTLGRHQTTGARGLQIAGLEFIECPLPPDALVGTWGNGVELSLRAYPAIHAAFSSMVIGLADTALRTAARAGQERQTGRRTVAENPKSRAALAGTFTDVLLADCLALVATRAVHLLPGQCDVIAAVSKYLVPKLIGDSLYDLSGLMGDTFHATSGEQAIFRKHLRDLATVTFGHLSSTVCQTVIAPYLPMLAVEPFTADSAAGPELFRLEESLPSLDGERLAQFGGGDGLAAYVAYAADRVPDAILGYPAGETLAQLIGLLQTELDKIREAAATLDELDGGTKAFALSDRYALVLAAASCLGVWLNAGAGPDPFLTDPSWLVLALHRLLRRLGVRTPALPTGVETLVCDEVLARARQARSFDLLGTELAG